MVRLISMAMTGYYRTLMRPRVHRPLSMMKYDPIGTQLPRTLPPSPRLPDPLFQTATEIGGLCHDRWKVYMSAEP